MEYIIDKTIKQNPTHGENKNYQEKSLETPHPKNVSIIFKYPCDFIGNFNNILQKREFIACFRLQYKVWKISNYFVK